MPRRRYIGSQTSPSASRTACTGTCCGCYREVLEGLRRGRSVCAGGLGSVGIDSWGVDFGLLRRHGALLGNPFHYRDARHAGGVELVHGRVPPNACTRGRDPGPAVQHDLPARGRAGDPSFAAARSMLLMPDLLGYWLTGVPGGEAHERLDDGPRRRLDRRNGRWS